MITTLSSSPAQKSTIQKFTDLFAWQAGHALVISIYEITKIFPKEEIFGITSQLRRAAVSVTSNIAEGFRKKSGKEKCHFYTISLGSITEIENQLMISRDVGYLTNQQFHEIMGKADIASKLTKSLCKKTESWG